MLSAGWLIAAVLAAILLTTWVTFTLTRLDRLHARVDAAQAALDAQLVRRSAALLHLAETPKSAVPVERATQWAAAAHAALSVGTADRQAAENQVGRVISGLDEIRAQLPAEAMSELTEASTRVVIARRFFNDAVRDTRTLRARRMPRLLHLAGRRELPQFFDIDDTSLFDSRARPEPPSARSSSAGTP
jgi:hypothetical protein